MTDGITEAIRAERRKGIDRVWNKGFPVILYIERENGGKRKIAPKK